MDLYKQALCVVGRPCASKFAKEFLENHENLPKLPKTSKFIKQKLNEVFYSQTVPSDCFLREDWKQECSNE